MTYRLLSFQSTAGPRAGLLVGERVYDAAQLTGREQWASVVAALQEWTSADTAFREAAKRVAANPAAADGQPLDRARLLAPLLYPGNIYCAGANYTDHFLEMERAAGRANGRNMKELGEQPWFFVKTARGSIVGPGAEVKLPSYSKAVDWEIELAAVIGKPARNVSAGDALDHVAGYTIANDLSARDAMVREKLPPATPFQYDWLSHKCFEGACPIGPWIVPPSELADPHRLAMKLWVGDELMQDSNTGRMIFDIAEQIEMLSSRITLHPGDLVLTGTPAGVGMGRKRFLRPGETVRLWIEGIGEFRHRVV
jgi:2-keto-4-pentenoate hydratase/2-oxohepta-3-ene-1,7-dioic acid hydratase in catechol pathway